MKKSNRKKVVKIPIFLIVLLIALIGFVFSKLNSNTVTNTKKNATIAYSMEGTEYEEAGRVGRIKQSIIVGRETGVGPFDDDNEPGNDKDADNDIVRSFDQITWSIANITELKDQHSGSYTGGVLQIKAELPGNIRMSGEAPYAKWDVDSMAGIFENIEVSEDGRTFTATRNLVDNEGEVTIPNSKEVKLVLKILGAPNGLEISPTITTNIVGNDENEKYTFTANNPDLTNPNSIVRVSAAPRLNISLVKNGVLNYRGYFDDTAKTEVEKENKTETTTYGRIQGYSLILQLYNQRAQQGLKGIEIPKGDITFDLTLNESIGTTTVTEQEGYTPKIWEYKENKSSNKGKNDKNMIWAGISASNYSYSTAPYNTGNTYNACYDGGIWTITHDSEKPYIYHVTVKNYRFNNEFTFPNRVASRSLAESRSYGENVGPFSVGYLQAIMQMPED